MCHRLMCKYLCAIKQNAKKSMNVSVCWIEIWIEGMRRWNERAKKVPFFVFARELCRLLASFFRRYCVYGKITTTTMREKKIQDWRGWETFFYVRPLNVLCLFLRLTLHPTLARRKDEKITIKNIWFSRK